MESSRKKHKMRGSDRIFEIILYLVSLLILVIVLYPMYFVVIASFSDPSSVASGQVWLYPRGFTLDGYSEILKHGEIWIGYRNTIFYTIAGTFFGLMVNVFAAYALSRKDLVGRRFFSLMFLFTMFFNGGTVPTFLAVRDFGFYDSWTVLIVPFAVSVYNIIVARTFFENTIPEDITDAAKIDGCGNLRYFFQIVLPLSKAILSVIALWTAVGMWNSYFNALIYLRDPNKQPLQIALRNILITNNMQMSFGSGEAMQVALRLSNLMRYSVIIVSTVPIMCFYPFVQKHFNKGVMIGAVKG